MKLTPILDETDKKIIELLCAGVPQKEIAGKVWKSKGAIHKRLHSLRKHYQVDTTIQLILKLKEVV